MAGSQCYIGAPNGIVVCVDRSEGRLVCGRMYHRYYDREIPFGNFDELIHRIDRFFDQINFPHASTTIREFLTDEKGAGTAPAVSEEYISESYMNGYRKEYREVMQDKELLEQHGYLETFIVRVQHRQNSTWQGRITWADENKTMNFRSIWEMIHLMESALDKDGHGPTVVEFANWDEDSIEPAGE